MSSWLFAHRNVKTREAYIRVTLIYIFISVLFFFFFTPFFAPFAKNGDVTPASSLCIFSIHFFFLLSQRTLERTTLHVAEIKVNKGKKNRRRVEIIYIYLIHIEFKIKIGILKNNQRLYLCFLFYKKDEIVFFFPQNN